LTIDDFCLIECGLKIRRRRGVRRSGIVTPEEMKKRTYGYAVQIIRAVEALPNTLSSYVLGDQLLRTGCSGGANDRAACRARSRADFIAQLKMVEEECDESLYWMEWIQDEELLKAERRSLLQEEGHSILSMVIASIRTARRNVDHRRSQTVIRPLGRFHVHACAQVRPRF
jgi:four helix bundle protein